MSKELITKLTQIEENLERNIDEIRSIMDEIQFPAFIERTNQAIEAGEVEKLTTSWLMKEFDIGYMQASRLLDRLSS